MKKISSSSDNFLSEYDLMVIAEIEKNSSVNQRDLAKTFKISLGKINYCIKALIDIGFIKLDNFSNAKNKLQYLYIFTP